MKEWIQKIARSELVRNSAKLLSANVIAQAIGLLVYPILTRLYSPEDFGLLNLFLSIGNICLLISTGEYQYAIVLPKQKKDAIACFHVGFFILVGVTLLCGISTLFSKQIAALFNAPALEGVYPLLCIFVFFSGLWIMLNYWYTRNKQYTKISIYQITQTISTACLKLGFGNVGWLSHGLIYSSVLGPIVGLVVNISAHYKRDIRPLLTFDWQRCREMSICYSNFPKFSLPRSIINTVSSNLPVLLLTPVFGLKNIGYFGMAITLSFAPISIISKSLYQVLYQQTTSLVQLKQKIRPLFMHYIRIILCTTVPCFITLYFILPTLTEWLLGTSWSITGEYIRLLLPWLFFSAIVVPLGPLTDIFMKQKWWLYFEIVTITLRFLAIMIGIGTNSIKTAVIGYSLASALGLVIQLPWYFRLISNYDKT